MLAKEKYILQNLAIFIGVMLTNPSHGWFTALFYPHPIAIPTWRLTAYFSADPRDPRFVRVWQRMLRAGTVRPTEEAFQMALKVAVTGRPSCQHAPLIYGKYLGVIVIHKWFIDNGK